MELLTGLLRVVVLVGTGLVAGVLFAVALSVVPALLAMPADRYVWAHTLLGRRYDRVMPWITAVAVLSAVVLAVRAHDARQASLYVAAAICMAGVAAVSQGGNVPINRRVKRTRPEDVGPGWDDPRRQWRSWHLLRTGLAMTACLLAAVAGVLP
ncbi:anthrone oxygenase family protein [Micromonospora sp. DT44]|uniref:anthrone oxygenase family protein n=1 Tax=Micromonospora sp. DT44 TaxID=3393439 RepID=UPI003CE7CA6A